MPHEKNTISNGHVSLKQLEAGIEACVRNARALVDDATLLFSNRRYPRCYSLIGTAFEEIGKIHILQQMAEIPKNNQKLWRHYWKQFRDHNIKTTRGVFNSLEDKFRKDLQTVFDTANKLHSQSIQMEKERQRGLYVDFSPREMTWIEPSEISKRIAQEKLIQVEEALVRIEGLEVLGFLSIKVLELRRKHYTCIRDPQFMRNIKPSELESFILKTHQSFFKDIVDQGILDLKQDFTVMGQSLHEYLKDTIPSKSESTEIGKNKK